MTKTKKHRQKNFRRKMAQKRITRKRNNRKLNNRKLNTRKLNTRKIGKKNKSKRLMKNYKGGTNHDERYVHIYECIKGLKQKDLLRSGVPENIDRSLEGLFRDLLSNKTWNDIFRTNIIRDTFHGGNYDLSDDENYFKVIEILKLIIDDKKMQQAIFDKKLFTEKELQNYEINNDVRKRTIYSTEKDGFKYILLIYNTDKIYKIKLPEPVAVAGEGEVAEPVAVAEPGEVVAQELVKPLTQPQILEQLLGFIQMRQEFFNVFTEDEKETINSASTMRIDESMSISMKQKITKYINELLVIISKQLNYDKLSIDIFNSPIYDKIKLTNWKRELDNLLLPIIEGENEGGSSVRVIIIKTFDIIGGIICLDIMNRIYILYYKNMDENNISLNFIDNKIILGMNEGGIVYKNTLNNSFYLFDGDRDIEFFNDTVKTIKYILIRKKIYNDSYEGQHRLGDKTFIGIDEPKPIENLEEYKNNIKSMLEYTGSIDDVNKEDDKLTLDNTLRFITNVETVYLKPIMQFDILSSKYDLCDYGFYIYNKHGSSISYKPCVILRNKDDTTKYGIIKFDSPTSKNDYKYNDDNITPLTTIKLLYSDIAVINDKELIYKTYNKDRNSVGLFILPLGYYETNSMIRSIEKTYIKIQLEIVCENVLISYKYTISIYNNRTSKYESNKLNGRYELLTFKEINKMLKKNKLPENIWIIGPDSQRIPEKLQTLIDDFNRDFSKYMKQEVAVAEQVAEPGAVAVAEPVAEDLTERQRLIIDFIGEFKEPIKQYLLNPKIPNTVEITFINDIINDIDSNRKFLINKKMKFDNDETYKSMISTLRQLLLTYNLDNHFSKKPIYKLNDWKREGSDGLIKYSFIQENREKGYTAQVVLAIRDDENKYMKLLTLDRKYILAKDNDKHIDKDKE